ncbi:MAG: sigma-70 family RNA polymerase sigma factor [Burkholderiales bacterium]|nr:sigma-70 family RNA polymerase sigma factor [Anaerolineae bacterium]
MLPLIVLPDIPAEDHLLARARQGDQDAVMRIYESYFAPIYQFIRLRVGDAQQAEDLSANVFLKLVTALRGQNAPRHSLRGWLFRVARNEIADHYGRARQLPLTTLDDWLPASADDDPDWRFIRSLDVERARRALRMLAADQQEVLVLRFGQALDLQATADIMGKSVSAVKSLQFRAVATLRGILGALQTEAAHE